PMVATVCEKRPEGFFSVPLNMRCSRKCARPVFPAVSSAEPTLYQTMWVTTGVRWSGMTTTSRPFSRVKWLTCGPGDAWTVVRTAAGLERTRNSARKMRGSTWGTTGPHGVAAGRRQTGIYDSKRGGCLETANSAVQYRGSVITNVTHRRVKRRDSRTRGGRLADSVWLGLGRGLVADRWLGQAPALRLLLERAVLLLFAEPKA